MGGTHSRLNRSHSKLSEGLLVCALLLSCLPLAACSAKYVGKHYPGPNLPETDVGTIIFRTTSTKVLGGLLTHHRQAVVLCKVDGERIEMDPETRSVNVLPGKHSLLFMYDGKRPLVAVEWTFNVEGGHKYLITFPDEQPDSGIMMWLENLTTGKRIMNVTSSPLKSAYVSNLPSWELTGGKGKGTFYFSASFLGRARGRKLASDVSR